MKRTYGYNGYSIYGVGDMFVLDCWVDDYFEGNVTEQLISEGAEFIETGKNAYGEDTAILKFRHITADFVKRVYL